MNWLNHVLDEEWSIKPAGGLTGDAFVAKKNNDRLFLKRNSSPFLAVLSAEGIVPKLIWTKRLENGDVITAQKWLEGRKLEPEEMKSKHVASILHKTHHSSELLHMLMRLGKRPITPDENYDKITNKLNENQLVIKYDETRLALSYLKQLLPVTRGQKQVVCHCDLNHNNLILTNEGQLYLIDWDNAMIADPVTDFGLVLKWYVPQKDWASWLENYGISKDRRLIKRMYWYLLLDALYYLNWHNERNELNKVLERLSDLQGLNEHIRTIILT